MPINLHVLDRSGQNHTIQSDEGATVMEALRGAGIDELLALCGGCCSCATCHIYISAGGMDRLQEISADESDLLESSDHRTERSRLACQLRVTADLDQLHIEIAPED